MFGSATTLTARAPPRSFILSAFRLLPRLMAALTVFWLAGCASWWSAGGPSLIQGQITLDPTSAIAPAAVVVQLIDRSQPTMPVILAEQTLVRPRGFPLAFSLPVIDASRLPATGQYQLEARLYDEQGERGHSPALNWQPAVSTAPLTLNMVISRP